MKKTILITGSTDGIGKGAAMKFAKDGHKVLMHGRNSEKLTAVIEEIKATIDQVDIDGFVADFAQMESVKKMARSVKERCAKLDVLINNAGIFKNPTKKTADGFDIRFAVNYLAPFLLTKKLLPTLIEGDAPRLINVSSAAQSTVSKAALGGEAELTAQASYAQSKLALTMWSLRLAREVPSVSVIAVNPGSLLNTNMVREAYGYHWSPADKGADILYQLAVSDKYRGLTGKYFDNDQGIFGNAHPDAYDDIAIDKLISKTQSLLS